MKIKKSSLELVFSSLNYPIKNFSKARVRDIFVSKLTNAIKQYGEERSKILNTLCDKDDKDKPLIEDGQYVFKSKPENKEQAVKEVDILNNEESDIEISKEIKELIENSEAELGIGMAEELSKIIK